MTKFTFLAVTLYSSLSLAGQQDLTGNDPYYIYKEYTQLNALIDCNQRSVAWVNTTIGKDTNNAKRLKSFYLDKSLPRECQQKKLSSYPKKISIVANLDRGHLIGANSQDVSDIAIKESNYMFNIVPQLASVNRKTGSWYRTEYLTECIREVAEATTIWAGPIWGDNPLDDYFYKSHGIRTPESLFKIIIQNDESIAWIIPNDKPAPSSNLFEYTVAIAEIEQQTGITIPISQNVNKLEVANPNSWVSEKKCDMR